jgi:hypothetical protein
LNQILHEVSQLTGITITGGVAEERVFGNYGPAQPSQVLGQLLDGTGSNMFFVSSTADKPAELILTPRNGGVTPPNPSAMHSDDSADADEQPVNPPPPPDSTPPPSPEPAASTQPAPSTSQPSAPMSPSASPSESGQDSTNGVRTPQQIYDQLMKLRQQQQQQQQQPR